MERTNPETPAKKKFQWWHILLLLSFIVSIVLHIYRNYYNPSPNSTDTLNSPAAPIIIKQNPVAKEIVPIPTEENGIYIEPFRVILQNAELKTESYEIHSELNFGTTVYHDRNDQKEDHSLVYLTEPIPGQPYPEPYWIKKDEIIPIYQFETYEKNFSFTPFNLISPEEKALIIASRSSNGNEYDITQNKERIKSIYCSGDFDNDGVPDLAVLLDNTEKQISRLLIIGHNSTIGNPYIIFTENYADMMRINSFKKGAKIFMKEKEAGFSPSPADGIILQAEDIKIAVVYDEALQKFKTYFQE